MKLKNVDVKVDDVVFNGKARWVRSNDKLIWWKDANNEYVDMIDNASMMERIRILEGDSRYRFWVNGDTLNIVNKNLISSEPEIMHISMPGIAYNVAKSA